MLRYLIRITKRHRRILVLIVSVLFGLVSSLSIPAWSNSNRASVKSYDSEFRTQGSSRKALELAREGQEKYNAGKFDEAANLWQEAAEAYRQVKDDEGMTKSLINKSQALQDLGLYSKACKALLQAFSMHDPDCNQQQLDKFLVTFSQQKDSVSPTQAIGLRSLGEVLRRQGFLVQSKKVLLLSLSGEKREPSSDILLSLANTERALGNQIRERWDYEGVTSIIDRKSQADALAPYQEAFKYYIQAAIATSASPTPKIQAQLNHFKLLLETQKWWEEQTNRRIVSWSRFGESKLIERGKDFLSQLEFKLNQDEQALQSQIELTLTTLSPNRAAIYAQINFAQSLIQSKQTDKVESLLNTGLKQARNLQDKRAETYALGYLGKLYYEQGQFSRAIELTRQALMLAQEQNIIGDAREITYLWQSQLGSLLRKQGDAKGAIAAYTAAFNTLQSLRSDLNTNNRDVQFNFLQEVKPVYLDLVDLLLKSKFSPEELNSLVVSNQKVEANKPKNRLELARRVIESLQLAELDNFFQDPCSEKRSSRNSQMGNRCIA